MARIKCVSGDSIENANSKVGFQGIGPSSLGHSIARQNGGFMKSSSIISSMMLESPLGDGHQVQQSGGVGVFSGAVEYIKSRAYSWMQPKPVFNEYVFLFLSLLQSENRVFRNSEISRC